VAAWRYLVPNLFTAVSTCLGLASILLSYEGQLHWAAWCILWCVLLDKLDGTAARLLGSTSAFGSQFDSMADLISFGLAPAVLIYSAGRAQIQFQIGEPGFWLLIGCCGWFALMAAVRLARFNSVDLGHQTRFFRGIPSTMCGAIAPSALLVVTQYDLPGEVVRGLPILLFLLGLGMVSRLPVPKVVPRKSRWLNWFQVANVAATYACGALTIFPEYILGLSLTYLLVGSLYGLMRSTGESGTPSVPASIAGRKGLERVGDPD
jgi:CDP-diacylglycerol--serine O-phosphatidyltransferase